MADQEDTTPTEPKKDEPHAAKPGVKDKGEIVKGAGGELMSGMIADIADGD